MIHQDYNHGFMVDKKKINICATVQKKGKWLKQKRNGKKRNLDHLAFNGYVTKLAIHLGYMSEFEFSLTGQH